MLVVLKAQVPAVRSGIGETACGYVMAYLFYVDNELYKHGFQPILKDIFEILCNKYIYKQNDFDFTNDFAFLEIVKSTTNKYQKLYQINPC